VYGKYIHVIKVDECNAAKIVLEAHSMITKFLVFVITFSILLFRNYITRKECGTQIHDLLVPVKEQEGYYRA
jgi:hypothetical protein